MDKEQLKAQPTGKRAERVPVWKKPLLTVTEAAEYTGIGKHTLWDNIDHACCLKARILREQGNLEESRQIIRRVNRHRHPELYGSGVEWFTKTMDDNIRNSLVNNNSKAEARGWRLLKLEKAIAYREAGQYPLTDDELERIIAELKDV